jgi:hypothetical protein
VALAAGKADSGPNVPTAKPIQLSPAGGIFVDAVLIHLKSGPSGGVVRFTLDGSEPTVRSEVFPKELKLTSTTLLRARVFDGAKPGAAVSETYTFIDRSLEKFTSNLPLVIINTFGHEIERENKIPASVRFIDTTNGRSSFTVAPDFDGRGDIALRGNSSLRYLKRSFSLKTRDEAWQSQSVSILGFAKDNDWVLYAPYPDKTLLRDVLAYDLSRQMGRYASRTKFVEVFLNQVGGKMTKRHHMGVYVLEEKIKRGKDRVNIAKLSTNDNAEPNLTGGYIFKKDHWDTQENVTPTVDGRPNGFGGNSGSRYGYPTEAGGFPADPAGFLPPVGGTRRPSRTGRTRDVVQSPFRMNEDAPPQLAPGEQPLERPRRDIIDPNTGERIQINRGPNSRQTVIVRDGRVVVMSRDSGSFGGNETFRTPQGNEFFYVEPKPEEITSAQATWLQNHLNEFERALHGPDFKDPVKGYAAYIDVDSFIDHHLLVELTKNIDGFRFSTFFQKDRGGKIKMEPIWDWNLSFGNANGKQGQMAEYWYWPQLDDNQYSYYRRLFEDPDFGQRYVDRWANVRATVFSDSNLMAKIDALVAELGDARVRNFERWPILSRRIWPNTFLGQTYEDEINYLKEFTRRRLAWVDKQFVAAPAVSPGKGSISFTASAGAIYYTLDGSDPRAPGGKPSAKAQLYSGPVKTPEKGKLFARALHDDRWSPPSKL